MKSIEDIKTIGVIGAGTMGRGIASVSALAGYKTVVYDVKEHALADAKHHILQGYFKLVEKGKIDKGKQSGAEEKLEITYRFDSISDCDVVIEAAVEDLEIKKELYKRISDLVSEDTILATNTSSFSVTSISCAAKNRERVVGMHFFNPAEIMKLVEIVKGEFTSADVVDIVKELCGRLGKTPVVCKDTPAFIVNRIARAFYGESLKILGEDKTDVKTIDTIMKEEGGFKMGPFELMDLIGIDVNLSVTKSVYDAFFNDPKYKPSPIQQKMVDSGLLGKKTKQGFY